MRSSLIALIGICLLTNAGMAGEPTGVGGGYGRHPLTIAEAVELGLRQSPTVLNQVQELKRLSGLVFQAQAALIPQVTGSGGYTQQEPTLAQTTTGTGSQPFDLLLLRRDSHLSFAQTEPPTRLAFP